ncbi:MAG: hypothetical protein V4534_04295 [Myxococcota bacterium]
MKKTWFLCLTLGFSAFGLNNARRISKAEFEAAINSPCGVDLVESRRYSLSKPSAPTCLSKGLTEALEVALFSDLVVYLGLGIKDPTELALQTSAAVLGYTVRVTGNEYFDNRNTDRNPYLGAAIGCLGGAAKYSGRSFIKGELSPVTPVLGCLDAGAYEGSSHVRGAWPLAEYIGLETTIGLAQLATNGIFVVMNMARPSTDTIASKIKSDAKVGGLIWLSIRTTLSTYEYVKKSILG